MEITITYNPQTVITVKGRLDTIHAPIFEKEILPILEGEMKEVVIDCSELNYISSSGLRLFRTLQKGAIAKKGNLILQGMKHEIKEIFDMTGFTSMFSFTEVT